MTRYTRDHQRPRVYFRDLSVPPALKTECWSPPVRYYRVGCLTDTNSEYPNHRLKQATQKQYMIYLNSMCDFPDLDFSICDPVRCTANSCRTQFSRFILEHMKRPYETNEEPVLPYLPPQLRTARPTVQCLLPSIHNLMLSVHVATNNTSTNSSLNCETYVFSLR
jgi:hypothetical protein